MQTFAEIQEKYGQVPLHLEGEFSDASAVLTLKGDDTQLTLSTTKFFKPAADENGWFDLTTCAPNGTGIALVNAMITGSTQFGFGFEDGSRRSQTSVFPNVVALNPGALGDELSVRVVRFQSNLLRHFFYYPVIEQRSLYRATAEELASLKAGRVRGERRSVFRPLNLYIVHGVPDLRGVRVADKTYKAGYTIHSRSPAFQGISVQGEPVATITFAEPVSLAAAMDEVWLWGRYFSLVAFEPGYVTALSAYGSTALRAPACDCYLPLEVEDLANAPKSRTGAHHIPFNMWNERNSLRSAMRSWFEKDQERNTFRVLVNRVIQHLAAGSIGMGDVVDLCAAVESLPELNAKGDATKAQIKAIADAAVSAAQVGAIPVDPARIRGVISGLGHTSLAARITAMLAALEEMQPEDQRLLVTHVCRLRNQAAHGKSLENVKLATLSPVVQALAAACSLYDLKDCGIPFRFRGSSHLRAVQAARFAMQELNRIARQGAQHGW